MINIGCALSGGAARGFFHLGVLNYLEEVEATPGIAAGTSIGALVGAFLANGYSAKETHQLFSNKRLLDFLRPQIPGKGIFQASGLEKLLQEHLPANFEDLHLPLYVTTTEVETGLERCWRTGPLVPAVLGSCSIPLLMEPVLLNGYHQADGGILNNLPAQIIHTKCRFLMGIDLMPFTPNQELASGWTYLEQLLALQLHHHSKTASSLCDLLITHPNLQQYRLLDTSKADELFNLGYSTAQSTLPHTNFLDLLQ